MDLKSIKKHEIPQGQAGITSQNNTASTLLQKPDKVTDNMLDNKLKTNKLTLLELCQKLSAGLQGGLSLRNTLLIIKSTPKYRRYFNTNTHQDPQDQLQSLFSALAPANSIFKTFPLKQVSNIQEFLDQTTTYLITQKDLKSTLIKKLLYPMLLIGLLTLFFTALMTILVPHYVQFFQQLNAPLPPLLHHAMALKKAFSTYSLPLLILLTTALGVGHLYLKKNYPGKYFKLKHPFYHSQLLWKLGLSLKNGCSLKQAIDLLHYPKYHSLHNPCIAFKQKLYTTGQFIPAYTQAFYPNPVLKEVLIQTDLAGTLNTQLLPLATQQFNQEKQTLIEGLKWVQPVLLLLIGLCLIAATLLILYPLQNSFEALLDI